MLSALLPLCWGGIHQTLPALVAAAGGVWRWSQFARLICGYRQKALIHPSPSRRGSRPSRRGFCLAVRGRLVSQKRACSVEPSPRTRIAFNTLSYMYMYVRTCPKHLLLVVAAVCWLAWTADFDGLFSLCVCPPAVCPAQRGGRTHQSRAAGTGDW